MDQVVIIALDTANHVLVLVLIALGLAIVFGLMGVINMAHGELLMIGAYVSHTVVQAGGSFWIGLVAAPMAVGALGIAIEGLLVRHIYRRFLDTILATWGLSILLKHAVVLLYGPASHSVAAPIAASVSVAGVEYPGYRVFLMLLSVIAVAVTLWLFFATRFGLKARAVIANRDVAACLGVNTRRLDRLTFAYGAALAGFAGAAVAPLVSIDPNMGIGYLVPAFLSVLIGGLGSVAAPLAGATVVGSAESLTSSLYSPVWAQVVVFALALVIIRLRPQGIVSVIRREH